MCAILDKLNFKTEPIFKLAIYSYVFDDFLNMIHVTTSLCSRRLQSVWCTVHECKLNLEQLIIVNI